MRSGYNPPYSESRDDWRQHWDEYAATAEKNPAQDYRRRLILSRLKLPGDGPGVRLLDVGSGQGDLARVLRSRYPAAEILGLELSASGTAMSRKKVPDATFIERDLLNSASIPAEHQTWATHAICSEVIEHVDDPVLLLHNARAYMRPGCRLIVTAPGGPMSQFDKHIGHRKHFRPDEFSNLFRLAGYELNYVSGAGFPFFNLYRCLIILRGNKLIEDVRVQPDCPASQLALLAMSTFQVLFRLNLASSSFGWQMVAEAHVPEESTDSVRSVRT